MAITAENYGHAVMLNLKGELAEDTLGAFRQVVEHQLENDEVVDVILNMEEVTTIDSAVLEYLLDLRDRLSEKFGQVRLAKCDENVRKILEITRLTGEFEMFDDVSEAVKVIRA